jgi:hypothetical protein
VSANNDGTTACGNKRVRFTPKGEAIEDTFALAIALHHARERRQSAPAFIADGTPHELFDAVTGNGPPESWMSAAMELETRAEQRDELRALIAEQVRYWGPYECCTHPERTGKNQNGCWGLLPWDEEGWTVPDPCAWCRYTHEHFTNREDAA